MKNIFVKIAVIFFGAIVVIVLGRDLIIKASIGGVAHKATGLRVSVGQFHSGVTASTIQVKDIKVYNPSSYTEKIMAHLPEIFVHYDLGSIISGKPHFQEVRLYLAELEIERNKEGKLNLKELKPKGGKKKDSAHKAAPSVRIDTLNLRIDKVVYKDFSKAVPTTQEFALNINETYHNVTDVRALAPIIVSNVMRNQLLRSLANFNANDLLQSFQASGIDVADFGLDKISGMLESGMGQTAQDIVGSAADTLTSLFGSSSKK